MTEQDEMIRLVLESLNLSLNDDCDEAMINKLTKSDNHLLYVLGRSIEEINNVGLLARRSAYSTILGELKERLKNEN